MPIVPCSKQLPILHPACHIVWGAVTVVVIVDAALGPALLSLAAEASSSQQQHPILFKAFVHGFFLAEMIHAFVNISTAERMVVSMGKHQHYVSNILLRSMRLECRRKLAMAVCRWLSPKLRPVFHSEGDEGELQQRSPSTINGGVFKTAATEVLQKEMCLLSTGEIARLALQRGLIKCSGKTPEATMASALYTDIKRKNGRSIFFKPREGLFGLREWEVNNIPYRDPTEEEGYIAPSPLSSPQTTIGY
eukprot:jgi/Botrbrau1/11028/Bobra.92_2s0001.1